MQKRLLTTFLLLLAVSVLAIFFIRSDNRGTDTPALVLIDIATADIDRIAVQRNGHRLDFEKQGPYWVMKSPLSARANPARIDAMLGLARHRSFVQIDARGKDLARYGLEPPGVTLHLDDHVFYFGTTDPIDEQRYVLAGDIIHLVNDNLFYQLQQPPLFFVNKKLVPEEEIVQAIRFSDRSVSRVGDSWMLTPADGNVSNEQLDNLVAAWQVAEARTLDHSGALPVLEKIMLSFRSGRVAQFDVLAPEPGLVLGRADLGIEYHLDQGVSAGLLGTHAAGETE